METIYSSFKNTIHFAIFNKVKTGNAMIDTVLSTVAFTSMSYAVKIMYEWYPFWNPVSIDIRSLFFKKNCIIFEGKRSATVTFNHYPITSTFLSDTFKALWEDIIKSIDSNKTIYEIKELCASNKDCGKNNNNDGIDLFVVSQRRPFLYNEALQIYAVADILSEDVTNEKQRPNTKTDKITITLYSFHSSLHTIKQHVKQLKDAYVNEIEKSRNNKLFIYTLAKTTFDDNKYDCWNEHPFESTRTFHNLFFEQKSDILQKIHFFLNNKQWYYDMGIPYTLGIGLHGRPGTGKTSFFKCLSNLTSRHLIVFSLKLIKTKRQLEDFFFEDRYHSKNQPRSLGFDKKIILIEDIDCLGDIVLNRGEKAITSKHSTTSMSTSSPSSELSTVLHTLIEHTQHDNDKLMTVIAKPSHDDPITLDDILNIIDGVLETPGRILGISSNYYEKLDPALIRPGRIDMSVKMDYVSHTILNQMAEKYYGTRLETELLTSIQEYFYSPAEIINCYIQHKDNFSGFITRLQQHKSF